jgi:hypothetical protein
MLAVFALLCAIGMLYLGAWVDAKIPSSEWWKIPTMVIILMFGLVSAGAGFGLSGHAMFEK